MNHSISNSAVTVTGLKFSRNMRAYPSRIELDGTSYRFVDAGIRAVVKKGAEFAEIFTMSDGQRDFRLKSEDHGRNWTLLSVRG